MFDYEVFNHIPNGVIVYENNKVEFINRQLLEILSVEFLSTEFAVDVVVKTLKVKDEKALKEHFLSLSYFKYKRKYIQINYREIGSKTIFIFTFIHETFKSIVPDGERDLGLEANAILKLFIDTRIKKVKTLVYHKGLPLKAGCRVHRVLKDHLELELEEKQMISLKARKDIYILPTNEKGKSAIEGTIYEANKRIVYVRDLRTIPVTVTTRDEIRLVPSDDLEFESKQGKLRIYDVAPTGISFHYNSKINFETIQSGFLLYDKLKKPVNLSYIKTIGETKAVYTIDTIDNVFIDGYMAKRQIDIIQEIHNYTKRTFKNTN
ncbi:MAG: hypothetical protein OIF32_10145 [Campylobacterales bacterium]|nr:hypothetical protein [Campylobacterales bacterium]